MLQNAMFLNHLVNTSAKYIMMAFGDLKYNGAQVESSFNKVNWGREMWILITTFLVDRVCELISSIAWTCAPAN